LKGLQSTEVLDVKWPEESLKTLKVASKCKRGEARRFRDGSSRPQETEDLREQETKLAKGGHKP